nr:tail fiber protein [Klebsiella phage vB_Kpn_K9PH25C2]
MTVKISGILKDALARPLANVAIRFLSLKTSSNIVIGVDTDFRTANDGSYDIDVVSGTYGVLMNFGSYEKIGEINVYNDSLPGTLEDFLTIPGIEEITPEILAQVIQARNNAVNAANNAASDATTIINEQLQNQKNEFDQFLLSSGYVFLGDYEDGPFQFSVRNQYIRYSNQYYRLDAATDVGFTTTGTDATSFASDVTHFVLMDGDTLRQNLGSSDGTSWVAKLGNKPLVAISYYKNQGLSDQDAVQAAFNESSNILIDHDIALTDYITFDRSEECYVYRKPGVTITGHGYLPKLRTNPAHVVETAIRHSKTSDRGGSYDRTYSHQSLAAEMVVHDVLSTDPGQENFVALYSGIESFNCQKQRMWAFNTVTSAHNLKTGDEIYGCEIDMNVDGTLDGGGQFVGVYIAGIGDVRTCANADGIRVQRLRDGVYKWQYGLRIFDSMTGINITDASTYSIFASGSAPIVRRKTTQDGGWSYTHSLSASSVKWGVDDYGDTYSRRLYLGTGDGKSKNRVNLDGGVSYYTTNAAVAWGSIAANAYVDKDITTLVGVSIADWTNYTIDVTPIGYAGAMPVVAVQAYINSTKTQAYVRIINISGAPLSSCNVGLNIKVSGHSATN